MSELAQQITETIGDYLDGTLNDHQMITIGEIIDRHLSAAKPVAPPNAWVKHSAEHELKINRSGHPYCGIANCEINELVSGTNPAAPAIDEGAEFTFEQLRAMTTTPMLSAHLPDYYGAVKQLFAVLTERAAATPPAPPVDADLAEAQRLYERLPEDEWSAEPSESLHDGSDCWVVDGESGSIAEMHTPYVEQQNAARWIALAHNLWPKLIASIRRTNG